MRCSSSLPERAEDVTMADEKEIWEEFGVTEDAWDRISAELDAADEKSENLIDYCKAVFPNSVQDQVRAFMIAVDFKDWDVDDDEGEEE